MVYLLRADVWTPDSRSRSSPESGTGCYMFVPGDGTDSVTPLVILAESYYLAGRQLTSNGIVCCNITYIHDLVWRNGPAGG